MTEYIEASDRVFRADIHPDTPGRCRRRVYISLEAGRPMPYAEWGQAVKAVVAGLVATGCDVEHWTAVRSDGDPT